MNKYRKEYCKENGSVKINPENTKLYDYIKHLENKLEQAKQLTLTDVSQRSKLYFAFMQEYNALMGKSEHQILKEEVIVLLAKYSS